VDCFSRPVVYVRRPRRSDEGGLSVRENSEGGA
jgi:hypothetical protein